jgi:putative transposase
VRRTGCQWTALHETALCSSRAAQRRFPAWTAAGVCLALWPSGLVAYQALKGLDGEGLAMDGAMTTAPLGGTQVGKQPPERGTLGTTRRVLTDGGGIPMGLAVEGAHRHDVKMAREPIASLPLARPEPTPARPQGRGLDTGDDVDAVRALLAEGGCTAHIRARGEAAKALKQALGFTARRWVVERTHRGMNRVRRVLSRWDKKGCHDLGFLPMAGASITYNQSGLLG